MADTYRDLRAWQKAFSLSLDVYRATKCFPKSEVYGLAAQMQRAAVSIPSNIAEGFGRRTTPDFLRSLYIAYGSICELQTQIMLATELGYIKSNTSVSLLQSAGDVERLTKAFIRALERKRAQL
ncbi:four helix bundle protein [candidate division WOR-3 bacterium]|uniref:Four helix bundle protein n=1 Tax=candidate division WOR-3 bacterium TaxID=2052148 RepID=A0A937XER5_UNCW3|nr:four helix bundle protein [candidate division WOR-3 bacterium]